MDVALVYLGLGDNDDDGEMQGMCKAIANKLRRARIGVRETNSGSKNLPKPNSVAADEVWFCGHSRFVEANMSKRRIAVRTLGGFEIPVIAAFVRDCIRYVPTRKFRLICCESAQTEGFIPRSVGTPADGLSAVLGNEFLRDLYDIRLIWKFNTTVDANVSHLEGLIIEMARSWLDDRKGRNQPAFDICGLWGAGDITDDDKPITSFLQDGGSLEAQAKMDDNKVKEPQRMKFAETFANAHCGIKGLPDFFGYKIREDVLLKWNDGRVKAAEAAAARAAAAVRQ
jgi:hypothetical protein